MQRRVLFIHGAGEPDDPQGSNKLAKWLASALGDDYRLLAPRMPEPENPRYASWRDAITQHLAEFEEPTILVGHSIGGTTLVKLLAEESVSTPVNGLFLVSVPYWGPGGWDYQDFRTPTDLADRLPRVPTFLYNSRNDPEVEFSHQALFAAQLPDATLRELAGDQHSFTDGLPVLADDIRSLRA